MVNNPKPGYYASHPTKSNEFYLLQLSKQGNAAQAQAAKNQLILQNEGFIKSFIHDWVNEGEFLDFNYLIQEARIAFLSAIECYDLTKDVSLRTYAKYYLLELKRQVFKKSKIVELKNEYCIDTCTIHNPDFKNFDLKNAIIAAVENCLSPVEQEVVYMHFFEGMKQKQIAKTRNCSEARISTILKTSFPKLKSYLINLGIAPWVLELN